MRGSACKQTELSTYTTRTRASKELYRRAVRVAPGGVMANVKFFSPYPFFAVRARGSRLVDVDNNEYIDYCLCYGAMILGHANSEIVDAVVEYLKGNHSTAYGVPTELEVILSEKITELLPSTDMIRLTNSGTEATLLALRLARAYSGKEMIAKFEGHYHGWHDFAVISQSPEVAKAGPSDRPRPLRDSAGILREIVKHTIVLPFNDLDATSALIKKHWRRIGAVIIEPVPRGYIVPEIDFLKGLREITKARDIPLVFDEVMTGFRLGPKGAQGLFGVEPDMTTFGKILGGGYPIGACAGREDIMKMASPGREGGVFHSGTFNASPISLVAGLKCIEILGRQGVYENLNALGQKLRAGLAEILAGTGAHVFGIGSVFHLLFSPLARVTNYRDTSIAQRSKLLQFDLQMLNRGVYFPPAHACFLSLAHTSSDLRATLASVSDVVHERKL